MIHVLFGPNTFTAQERMRELREQYTKEYPSVSISSFSEENFSIDVLEHALRHTGLFHEQTIIIAKYILSSAETRRAFLKLIPLIHTSSTVVLIQETGLHADIKKHIEKYAEQYTLEEHPAFTPKKLTIWLTDQAEKKDIRLTPEECSEFIRVHGEDPWMLIHALELRALGAYKDTLAEKNDKDMFRLLDAITEKKTGEAFVLYHHILAGGTSTTDIFWKIYWQFKNLLLVSSYGHLPPSSLAVKTKLHPFVIKKASWALARFTKPELESIFEWLITLWQDDKTKARDLPGELELFMLTSRPLVLSSRFL